MHRNSVTGWSLLQLSLFTPEFSEYPKQRYQLALGGGPCHHLPIAFFNLARLLVKIPGKFFAQSAVHQNIEKSHLLAGNFQAFLFHFKINLTSIGIEIESKSGMETWIKSSEWDASKLTAALLGRYFKFPFKDKSQKNIIDYAHWYYNPVYTAKQINDELDPEVATFAEGQIYVDFGKFLEKEVNDPQIKEFFELIFKVKEFQALQKSNEQLKPDENKDKAEDTIEEILEIVPSLSALYQSIENLRVYGSKLPNKFIGDHVDWLVQSLNAQANQMNKMISTQAVTVEEVEQFKSEFKALLHSKDDLMSEHRILWKPIIANVLLCLASFGLGLIAIAIKTGFGLARSCKEDKKLAASGMLFFAETHREKLISAIEQEVPMIESALTF